MTTGNALFSQNDSQVETPFLQAAKTMKTVLWNDSSDPKELARSIDFGAVGATCNPVIALTTIKGNLGKWKGHLEEIAHSHPTASHSEIGWLAVEALSLEAAQLLEPIFERTGGRDGRLSIQTDPRLHRSVAAIVEQAVHFSELVPNIIVKIPATSVGILAIEEATYRGVSINVTVSFTVSQAIAGAEAIERGLNRRSAGGLPAKEFGSVVTIMGGRLDDWLKHCASRDQVLFDPGFLEWAGVATMKRAYEIFVARGYRSRILSAAFRNHMQWSELVGGDLVVSPPFDWQLRINENAIPVENRIDVPIDPIIFDALYSRLSDFRRAYEVDGLSIHEFDDFGPTRRTLRQFLGATAELEALVRDVLLPDAG